MKRNTKWIVLLLVIVMVLAACAPTSETTNPQPDPTKAPQQSSTPDKEKEEEPPPEEEKLEPYELTWFMLANTITPDVEMIMEKLNPLVEAKINATVKINMLDWGTYQERFSTAMNAGEKIDLCFTADWWYLLDYVANKFLTPLNDDNGPEGNLLQKYAPTVIEQLGEGFIVGSQVDGVNYGVPTDKEFAVNAGFVWNQDLAEKYGFDMTKFNKDSKLEDFEPLLKTIKENEPNVTPYLMNNGGWMYTIPFTSFIGDFGVDYSVLDDKEIKFYYEMDKAVEMMKVHQKFYELGYIARDAYTDNNRADDILLEGNFFLCQQPLKPFKGKSTDLMTAAGNRFKLDEVETTPLVGASVHAAGSMMAIPSTSADPARAMMFINLMHTDPEIANLLVWGVEGVHHKVVSEGPPKVVTAIADNNWTSAELNWTMGNVFIHWMGDNEDPRKLDGFRQTKEDAPSHATLGYRFRKTQDYQAEMAAINNALSEYSSILRTGATQDFDGDMAKMIKAAEAAGLRTVQKAVQDDLNAWLAK